MEGNSRIGQTNAGPFLSAGDERGPRTKANIPGRWCLSAARRTPCVTSRHCVGSGDAGWPPPRRPPKRQTPPRACEVHSPVSGKLWLWEALASGIFHREEFKLRGMPRPSPQMPLATKPAEDEVWIQKASVSKIAFARPSPLGAAGSLGGGLVLCLGGDQPHSEHSFSVPTCLFACFKSEAPGTAFSFCFLPVAGFEGLAWSWNQELNKLQDIPHPPDCTPPPGSPPRAGHPRLSGPRLPVGPSSPPSSWDSCAPPPRPLLSGRKAEISAVHTGQAGSQRPLRPGRREGTES